MGQKKLASKSNSKTNKLSSYPFESIEARKEQYLKTQKDFEQREQTALLKYKQEIESVPYVGLMDLIEQAKNEHIVNIMRWLSTGRFLPEHWNIFGLPNLQSESRHDFLRIGKEIISIEPLLNPDDFRRFENTILGFIELWQSWRIRAKKEDVEKMLWSKWIEKNKVLYDEWQEIIGWCNELLRQINLIDIKISERKPAKSITENTNQKPDIQKSGGAAETIEIELGRFSNSGSKKLLLNLINNNPQKVTKNIKEYGDQPRGLKKRLSDNGYKNIVKYIHQYKDNIYVDTKIRLIAKK